MPELPEVETIRTSLSRHLIGKKISRIEIKPDFAKKISPNAADFAKELTGETIKQISRRAKMLIFSFGKDKKVLVHLKMTGQFVYSDNKLIESGGHPIEQTKNEPVRFNKVLFYFTDGSKLYFNDIRKFGYLKLVDDSLAKAALSQYGVEPLDKDFTLKNFLAILQTKKNLALKKVLLDQRLIAGLGNIYVDESCFAAGIRSSRRVKSLRLAEKKKLFAEIKRIIKKAVKHRGTSVNTYVDGLGQKGSYVKFLKVYSRAGELCLKCKTEKIKKIKLAGRGTNFCPRCQK
jgi:formamidopyrimidine-DNA glycosylase